MHEGKTGHRGRVAGDGMFGRAVQWLLGLALTLLLWPAAALAQAGGPVANATPISLEPVDAHQLERNRGQGLDSGLAASMSERKLGVILWDEYRKLGLPPAPKDGTLPATEVVVLPPRRP